MTKTRIEQFFSDHADTLEAYNAKYAELSDADFTFETKTDPVSNYIERAIDALEDDADPAIEDGFDWVDDESEAEPAWGPRP